MCALWMVYYSVKKLYYKKDTHEPLQSIDILCFDQLFVLKSEAF